MDDSIIQNLLKSNVDIFNSHKQFIENTSNEPLMPVDNLGKRFNKNPNSYSSTGLGLAIVKAIADVFGLTVTYLYKRRHVFKLIRNTLKNLFLPSRKQK